MPRWVRKVKVDNNLSADEEILDTETVETPEVSVVKSRPYRVFDKRANLVAQVNSLEEAEDELSRFVGGFIKMI